MRSALPRFLVALALLLGAAVPTAAGATARSSGGGSSPARFSTIQLGPSTSFNTKGEIDRYQVVIIQATQTYEIPRLRRANPHVKILIYQDPFLARPSDPTGLSVCSTYPSLSAAHGSWFLLNKQGQRIPDAYSSGDELMNLGNAAYRRSCIAHAVALARRSHANGVLFDDITARLFYLPAGEQVATYSRPASWQKAQTSFLTEATAALHAKHMLAFANLGGTAPYRGLWERWDSILDGAQEQSWNNWGDGGARGIAFYWRGLLAEAAWAEAHHKYTVLESEDNGESENTLGLASMLLVANGWTSYCTANLNPINDLQWYPTYAAAGRLGAALGKYRSIGSGLYERRFANGLVIVDPTLHSRRVKLSGAMTDTATGLTETSVLASPTSGYILLHA